MKKIIIVIACVAVVGILVMPFVSSAATFKAAEDNLMVSDETDDLYAAANNITITKPVMGDLFAGAGNFYLNEGADVEQDLNIGAGQAYINANIGDDARIGAGQAEIIGNVGGDLLVGAGAINLIGDVSGDMYVGGGELLIEGKVNGDVHFSGGTIALRKTAKIEGNLIYSSDREVVVEDGAEIVGETKFKKVESAKGQNSYTTGLGVIGGLGAMFGITMPVVFILCLIGLILLGLAVVFAAPLKARDVAMRVVKHPGRSFGFGLIYLIVTPIVAIILLVLFVTFPIGIMIGLVFIVSLIMIKALLAFFIGARVLKLFKKDYNETSKSYLAWSVVIGAVIYTIILFIPFLGFLLILIGTIFVMGAFVETVRPLVFKKREWSGTDDVMER